MYEKYLRESVGRPEIYAWDEATQTITTHSDVIIDDDIRANLRRKLNYQIQQFNTEHRSSNQYAAMGDVVDRLKMFLDDPNLPNLDLFDECENALLDLTTLIEKGEISDDLFPNGFVRDLATSVADIVANDETVADMVNRRKGKTVTAPAAESEEAKSLLIAIAEAITLTEGRLKDRLLREFVRVQDWIETNTPVQNMTAWQYRIASTLLEIRCLMLEAPEAIVPKLKAQDLSKVWMELQMAGYQVWDVLEKVGIVASPILTSAELLALIACCFSQSGNKK